MPVISYDLRHWHCHCGRENSLKFLICECGSRRWSRIGVSDSDALDLLDAVAPAGVLVAA